MISSYPPPLVRRISRTAAAEVPLSAAAPRDPQSYRYTRASPPFPPHLQRPCSRARNPERAVCASSAARTKCSRSSSSFCPWGFFGDVDVISHLQFDNHRFNGGHRTGTRQPPNKPGSPSPFPMRRRRVQIDFRHFVFGLLSQVGKPFSHAALDLSLLGNQAGEILGHPEIALNRRHRGEPSRPPLPFRPRLDRHYGGSVVLAAEGWHTFGYKCKVGTGTLAVQAGNRR